jgi:hypothetical protein
MRASYAPYRFAVTTPFLKAPDLRPCGQSGLCVVELINSLIHPRPFLPSLKKKGKEGSNTIKTEGFTAVQFTEFCNRIALQMILKPVSKSTYNEEYIEINDEIEVEIELAD